MKKRVPMSKGETGVARALWCIKSGTARQVFEQLQELGTRIDFSTVQTYLHRLEEKGYVTSSLRGRVKWFKPKVSPARVVKDAVDDFVASLFDGNSMPLLQHLIEQRDVSKDDLGKLRELLDELEDNR